MTKLSMALLIFLASCRVRAVALIELAKTASVNVRERTLASKSSINESSSGDVASEMKSSARRAAETGIGRISLLAKSSTADDVRVM